MLEGYARKGAVIEGVGDGVESTSANPTIEDVSMWLSG
jgi:hypothetical protein